MYILTLLIYDPGYKFEKLTRVYVIFLLIFFLLSSFDIGSFKKKNFVIFFFSIQSSNIMTWVTSLTG